MIFEPLTIHGVTFKNRVVRSSVGGRSAYYDGTVNPAWKRFETRFAERGVAALISGTFPVDDRRWSPLEYPKLSQDRFVAPLRDGIRAVQEHDCRYLIQIGDPGSHTQTSLLPEAADSRSASSVFDLVFGYANRSTPMSLDEIRRTVRNFADAARRAREAGADGLEVTASKGYLIHQFLNPVTNRRKDDYGGSVENRFRLLREVIEAVRREVGRDYLLGVRLSAEDLSGQPFNLRWPPVWPRRDRRGNGVDVMLGYALELKSLGVDFLHMTSGFGFINPHESPGSWPIDEFRMFVNSVRHLSRKAWMRASLLNALPRRLAKALFGKGWRYVPAPNAEYARIFRERVGLPVISNGGYQRRSTVEEALAKGKCDLVSMARPLLANPDLVELYRRGIEEPEKPCTHCNRCPVATALLPLGCYDRSRFESQEAMEAQILWFSGGPHVAG